MIATKRRDITRLRREDLLDDYWSIAQRRKGALVNTALRTRSTSMRDILVRGATKLVGDSEQLKQRLLSGSFTAEDVLDHAPLADLGRLVILQNLLDNDLAFGEGLLKLAISCSPRNKLSTKNALVLIQHLIVAGKIDEAKALLESYPKIDADYFEYLTAETFNPFGNGTSSSPKYWLRYFNRMFLENNIAPISLDESENLPFDRLRCDVESFERTDKGPLVSVILTSYKPDKTAFFTSVNSILKQTWQNLELIIVDDCSGAKYEAIFETVAALDSRITVIHSPVNQGTYVSRNIGYAAATGDYITGQDDDDWSHPERIAEQLKYLDENPGAIGCRVTAVRCDENLGRVRVGYSPMGENASSLLIRREGYEQAGNYLPARKGADTEYHFRIEEVTGRSVGRVRAPLTIIRILSDSLSRGDFSPGWKHPARRSFRSSYELWHKTSSSKELYVDKKSEPTVKIPRRFLDALNTARSSELDVVFAGPWEKFGGPQKSMLEEIHALVGEGYRVGILNLEAARFMNSNFQTPLRPEIQSLINSGYVDEVQFDDQVAVKLLLLRYPPILQFFTHDVTNLLIEKLVIVANQAPSELDGSDIRYLVEECHTTAQAAFGLSPIWVPQGPHVRRFLELYLESSFLAPFDLRGVLDIESWWRDRSGPRSLTPVVGRHSRDNRMKWPEDPEIVKTVYPADGSYDIRILGGADTPKALTRRDDGLSGWTVYENNEVPVKSFLQGLDYYVFFQHSEAVEAFGRAILEAIASGLVVILPKHFQEVFGDAALYAQPDEVRDLIHTFHSDFSRYKAHLHTSRRVLESEFSYAACIRRMERLIALQHPEETQ